MSEGWIKLYRSIRDHWIFKDAERFRAWIIILMEVNHSSQRVIIRGEVYECDIGQSLLSYDSWAERFGNGWTKQKVRTFFSLLEKDEMLTHEGLHYTTRVTVCNYKSYQIEGVHTQHTDNTPTNTPITHGQHADNTPITPNKNDKNDNNGKNDKKNTDMIEFGHFWDSYPKKVDKQGSIRSFVKAIKKTTLGTMLSALETQKVSSQWQKNAGQFIPNPTTWLNQERWNQTIEIEDTQSWEYLNRELLKESNNGQDHIAIGRDSQSL